MYNHTWLSDPNRESGTIYTYNTEQPRVFEPIGKCPPNDLNTMETR